MPIDELPPYQDQIATFTIEVKVLQCCNGALHLSVPNVRTKSPNDQKGAVLCGFCGLKTAFRSHRKHFIEFLRTRLTGKVPFRCTRCKRRFWSLIDPNDI
jgi:hypothetical protein